MAFLPPGVPTLLEAVVFNLPTLLTSDTLTTNVLGSFFSFAGQSQWGIFDDQGNQVVQPDSCISMEHPGKEHLISDYPVEQGAFESYDKVETPREITVRMAKGGSLLDRQQFLQSIEAIAGDLNFYTVVTPEVSYPSMNVSKAPDYSRRSDKGAGLITVDIHMMEIRVTATQGFENVQSPPSADPVNGGTVQPQTPAAAGVSTQTQSSILSGLF